jgi:hypothetical protein
LEEYNSVSSRFERNLVSLSRSEFGEYKPVYTLHILRCESDDKEEADDGLDCFGMI